MTEFQALAHAAEMGLLYEGGTGGNFTPVLVLCDWLEERGDGRVPVIRRTMRFCQEHADVLHRWMLACRNQLLHSGKFIATMITRHQFLSDTNKRLMLLLANRPVPADPKEFRATKAPCWLDAKETP